MIIYVEYVVIDNMVIDTLILLTTCALSKTKTTKLKIFLSAFIGTAASLISPILPNIINLLVKPLVAILMVITAFKITSKQNFFILVILFFISTFLYGGACFGICELLGIKMLVQNGVMYEYRFPIGLILLICAITYFSAKNIIVYCTNRHKNDEYLYKITFQNNGISYSTLAFLDTGNCIMDEKKPVTIINYKIFSKLFPKIPLQNILLKKPMELKNQKYFKVQGISSMSENILTFDIEKIIVNKCETKEAKLGLSLKNFEEQTQAEAIISKDILEG